MKITGYSDRISVAPGERVRFMVNCEDPAGYRADIVRLVCGDLNPDGPGYKEEVIATPANGRYPGRRQTIDAGSFIRVPPAEPLRRLESFSLSAFVWPTTPAKGLQGLLGHWSSAAGAGYALVIDEAGTLALLLGDGAGTVRRIGGGRPLLRKQWYYVAARYDRATGMAGLYQEAVGGSMPGDDAMEVAETVDVAPVAPDGAPFLMAALLAEIGSGGRVRASAHYNGKIADARLYDAALGGVELRAPDRLRDSLVAAWDFARDIGSDRIVDLGPNRLHGSAVNQPARAMTGPNWTGAEMNWRRAPKQYDAIHFHDDDLADAGWEADFALTVPEGMPSGLYAARLRAGSDGPEVPADERDPASEDYLVFAVRPPRLPDGRPRTANRIAFLLPTATYMAYANWRGAMYSQRGELTVGHVPVLYPHDLFLAEHVEYGFSCYDLHSDGSGVAYSSRLRPVLNMRPKVRMHVGGAFGSSLWGFNADTHIADWLEAKGFAFDVVTDEDLHLEGLKLLEPYRVVLTGTHPEYLSAEMWDALTAYTRRGGRLVYFGGNGFYWRVAFHPDNPAILEVRRAEDGTRSWAAEPGEYYHSLTGEYGGLWRRQGRTPNQLVGVGFTAQGFDICSHYRRRPDSFDPRAAFIFEGIGTDEPIGNFGLQGGGAAGLEIDCHDVELGSPPHALVLASSEDHTDTYLLVNEEFTVSRPDIGGQENALVRADMVFFETGHGGAVFSTGSIAWCGSVAWNGYDNNVSRITENVVRRFMDDEPL